MSDTTSEQRSHGSDNFRLMLQCVIALCMAVGAWFAKEVWEGQKELAARAESRYILLSEQIARLDKAAAVVESNRFTVSDWAKASDTIAQRFATVERRVDRNADAIELITASLKKIEANTSK